jgi:curli biogenesis system outer membrane secretion channel CsgG
LETVQRWWDGNWDIGKGISDLLVDRLLSEGTFSVIERRKLDMVLAEQNFSTSERADSSTAARIGKVLGVNAIILGSVTQFGTEKKDFNASGIGGGRGGLGAGRWGRARARRRWHYGAHHRHQHGRSAGLRPLAVASHLEAGCYLVAW